MEESILLISEKKSMLVNALAEGLQKEGFEVLQATTDAEELNEMSRRAKIVLFYLPGTNTMGDIRNAKDKENVLQFILTEYRRKVDVMLFLIGNTTDLEQAATEFPPEIVKGTFTRPFRVDEMAAKLRKASSGEEKKEELKRILVVDDDATMLRTLKAMLSDKYRVYTANSGMNAIQLLLKTPVDLIMLDYEMPVVKGPQVLEMLRSEQQLKDIPVMFLTAKTDRQSISEVLSLNPESYLLKSLPQAKILDTINNFFARG